jgi:hypothetical protein
MTFSPSTPRMRSRMAQRLGPWSNVGVQPTIGKGGFGFGDEGFEVRRRRR